MSYKILETRIEFQDNKIIRVTVLTDCTSSSSKPLTDVRAITATNKPNPGYTFIMPDAVLNEDLLQKVAGYGMQVDQRDKIFSNWKRNIQNQK